MYRVCSLKLYEYSYICFTIRLALLSADDHGRFAIARIILVPRLLLRFQVPARLNTVGSEGVYEA